MGIPVSMKEKPRVTVLMSVYNGEKYLREAIDSILGQTFKDFEFLILDDGSTDSSAEIIRSYSDPRIRLIQNEKNIGLTRSLNKGLKLANAQYIARMDADDISLPERLEKQTAFLFKNLGYGVVGSSYYHIDGSGKRGPLIRVLTKNSEIQKELKKKNWFGHGSVMMRRDAVLEAGGYDERYKYAQDYDLWLRIAKAYRLANIEQPLYCWRVTPFCISERKKAEQKHYANLIILRADIRERKILFDLRRLVLKLKEYRIRRQLKLIEKTDRKSV